ncbi:hypothetical protein GCM10009113_19770 [Marinobacter szutsaonensis]
MSRKTLTGSALVFAVLPAMAFAGSPPNPEKAQLTYRQYYWNEDPGSGVGPTRDEWVHALQFDFNSRFYRDVIGIDLGVGAADALAVGNDANSITNLSADGDIQNPDSIAKATTAYLKLRFGGEHHRFRAGWGKKRRDYHLYADNNTRILPAGSIGFDVGYDYKDLSLYASRLDRFSPRNESGWGDELQTFDGQSIDSVDLAGLASTLPANLKLEAEYLTARDYMDATFLNLSREFAITGNSFIAVALAHGNQRDGGDLFEEQGVPGFYPAEDDHDASFNEISVTWHRKGHYAGVAFTNVYGSHYDRVLFAGDYGTWDSEADNFYRFGLEGEAMAKLSVGVDLAEWGVKGLRWDGYYAHSDEADGYTGFSRREFLSFLKYRFPGQLRGLSLAWLHVNFETRGQVGPDSNKELTFGPAGFITHDADRIYLTYTYEL